MNKKSDEDSTEPKLTKVGFMEKFKSVFFSLCNSKNNRLPHAQDKNDSSHNARGATQQQLINNTYKFIEKTVDDVMVPRSNIVALDIKCGVEDLKKVILKHSYARIMIYKSKLDNIVGFVHIKDVFKNIINSEPLSIKKILRNHVVTTSSMKLIDLLQEMQSSRTHIAIVVDEYGGTDGIVTIEDIIEAIVGNIYDEHDTNDEKCYKLVGPGVVITNARLKIKDLEDLIGVTLKNPEDNFDTIGGLVMAKSSVIPNIGDIIDIHQEVVAEILDATPRTIKKLKIKCIVQTLDIVKASK